MKIKHIPVGQIIRAPYNSQLRTSPQALNRLKKSIQKYGQLNPCSVVNSGPKDTPYMLVDGHRRFTAQLELDAKTVPCVELDASDGVNRGCAADLWATMGGGTAPATALHWLDFYIRTDAKHMKEMPCQVTAHIRQCEKIFGGMVGLKYLLEHKQSPHVETAVGKLHRLFAAANKSVDIRPLGFWIVNHKLYSVIVTVTRPSYPLGPRGIARLFRAFKGNKGITVPEVFA